MSEKTNTMALWDAVWRTDPAYTKPVNERGGRFTDFDPMWLIQQATRQWGPYGSTWGLKHIKREFFPCPTDPLAATHTNRYCIMSAVFYYPDGEFEIGNEIPVFSAKQNLYDDGFIKKVETNTLSKALSKLGFGADVFLGKFDDARYVAEQRAAMAEQTPPDAASLAALRGFIAAGLTTEEKVCSAHGVTTLDQIPADALERVVGILRKRQEAANAGP